MRRLLGSVYLKVPNLEELSFTEQLLSDEATMNFNKKWGGTVSFPKEKWKHFFDEYNENDDRYYFHIYNLDGIFVGEVSSRYDTAFESQMLNIKIMYRFRGNNHAKDALESFLTYLFEDLDISKIQDNVGHESKAGIRLLKSFGFNEIDKTDEYILMELKKDDFC